MKIVHVLTRLLRAGSEENTLASCRDQAQKGHEVYLYHGDEYDKRYYAADLSGVKLIEVKSLRHKISFINDVKAFLELKKEFERIKPDIVHTHQSKAGVIGRFAAAAAKVPVVIHGVHIVPFENVGFLQKHIYLIAEKAAAGVTHAFIDVSTGMKDVYIRAGIGDLSRHHVIHSGFNLSKFQSASEPENWREIAKISNNESRPPIVLMLAALEPRKRHIEFLEQFSHVVKSHPNVRLLLGGEGPSKQLIQDKIDSLNLQSNVILLGYRTNPDQLIALADLCILTSCREGLPRVVMQYLAVGKTCVVNNLPGLGEVLSDQVNGVIVPADSMLAAAQAVRDLLNDKEKLELLTRGAKDTDLSSWEVENMCNKILSVYSQYRYAV